MTQKREWSSMPVTTETPMPLVRGQWGTEVPNFHTDLGFRLARPEGFEPPTLGLEVRRSFH